MCWVQRTLVTSSPSASRSPTSCTSFCSRRLSPGESKWNGSRSEKHFVSESNNHNFVFVNLFVEPGEGCSSSRAVDESDGGRSRGGEEREGKGDLALALEDALGHQ